MGNSLKQPILGLAGAVFVLAIALSIAAQFDPLTFGSWVPLIVLSGLPVQVVVGLVWKGDYPGFLKGLGQPAKGIAIFLMMTAVSAVVAPILLGSIGGDLKPPTPFVVMFVIFSVLNLFWLITTFQCWPMTAFTKHPAVIGIGIWAITYIFTWITFRLFFDFGAMQAAPFYQAAADPHGIFPAWVALGFSCTTVLVTMGLVLLDFWPLSQFPGLARQPLFGVAATLLIIVVSLVIQYLGLSVFHMDPPDFMVRVAVSGLFGEFILVVLMQMSVFGGLVQPVKGIARLVLVAVLAVVMQRFYQWAGLTLVGPMTNQAPDFALELWTANAMLGVTFPVIAVFGDSFGFWPLKSGRPD